ncbi:hypothetical protein LPTSP2_39240 [Leptospira ellinghausenii]|uniref:DAC domain-containing protein n=1 Tax=Leptospira ellinghausenii TaxID=1917822 RepID=A0A2P2DJ59_9LEPT|nr:hypothetical protein [Leptospira ellinghausenii]GBF44621.1 hypothetical protein LPTSP2_39240 [Leptospira ellinghausenii]
MRKEIYNYLENLFPGSRIIENSNNENSSLEKNNKNRKSINISLMDTIYEVTKLNTFNSVDSFLFRLVANQLENYQNLEFNHEISNSIIENIFDNAILRSFILEDFDNFDQPYLNNLITDLLKGLQFWRNKTYEGKNISFGFIIENSFERDFYNYENLNRIQKHIEKDYFAPLSDGMCSFIKINLNGDIIGLNQFDNFYDDSMLPYRFSSVNNLRNSSVLIQTRLGDILLIKDGNLKFVKKNKQWIQFDTNSLMHKISANLQIYERKLKEAVFQTCLDISLAKTGGVLAVVDEEAFDVKKLISYDLNENSDFQIKKEFLYSLTKGQKFQDLSRSLRKEILSIDGSTVINRKGHILLIGTIIRISGGSLGGGRTAACVELSKSGAAIKLSTDGYIEVYADGNRRPILKID